jgi:hypothetical protein
MPYDHTEWSGRIGSDGMFPQISHFCKTINPIDKEPIVLMEGP